MSTGLACLLLIAHILLVPNTVCLCWAAYNKYSHKSPNRVRYKQPSTVPSLGQINGPLLMVYNKHIGIQYYYLGLISSTGYIYH